MAYGHDDTARVLVDGLYESGRTLAADDLAWLLHVHDEHIRVPVSLRVATWKRIRAEIDGSVVQSESWYRLIYVPESDRIFLFTQGVDGSWRLESEYDVRRKFNGDTRKALREARSDIRAYQRVYIDTDIYRRP